MLNAIGTVLFAYNFSSVLVEIQGLESKDRGAGRKDRGRGHALASFSLFQSCNASGVAKLGVGGLGGGARWAAANPGRTQIPFSLLPLGW